MKLRHLGYAVLVVHHTNKAGEQRGASILEVPMDYIIKLSGPDKSETAFKEGACFNVGFTKVRNKAPINREFMCELQERPGGGVEFALTTSMTEIPHEYTLLRAIAECDVKPSVRLFRNKLGFSNGKISKLLSKLRKEKALIGDSYSISERGKCLLHEMFPQNYPEPNSYKAYRDEIPF